MSNCSLTSELCPVVKRGKDYYLVLVSVIFPPPRSRNSYNPRGERNREALLRKHIPASGVITVGAMQNESKERSNNGLMIGVGGMGQIKGNFSPQAGRPIL